MTPQRRQLWANYFKHLANRMGLYDWLLLVLADPPNNSDAAASIETIEGKKVAHIRLAEDWDDFGPTIQREYAVHELVHPHFEQAAVYVKDMIIEPHLAFPVKQSTYDYYRYLVEFGIDALAKVLASHLALPGDVIPELGKGKPVEEPAKSEGKGSLIACSKNCGYLTKDLYDLHEYPILGGGRYCPYCTRNAELGILRGIAQPKEKPYQCASCSKTISLKEAWPSTEDDTVVYRCEKCQQGHVGLSEQQKKELEQA
jgi:hypothetical protein